jgi:MutS domain V
MRVFLMHPDRDLEIKDALRDEIFDAIVRGTPWALPAVKRELERRRRSAPPPARPSHEDLLAADLELELVWEAMAAGDEFIFEVARRVLPSSLTDPEEIVYRQRVLADCLEHRELVRELYAVALRALAAERDVGGLWRGAGPSQVLGRSTRLLGLYVGALRRLREIADGRRRDGFRSEGWARFFAMIERELDDGYLDRVQGHLGELDPDRGVLESAELGNGDKGQAYVLHRPGERQTGWRERLLPWVRGPGYSFELHPRDESGLRALQELKARALNATADALAQSADHVQRFFSQLRIELAFYLGCLNLHGSLAERGAAVCFPVPLSGTEPRLRARALYDVCLVLRGVAAVVANDADGERKSMVVITGANQGGKSTFLRSVGVAQLMLQCGMFVGAGSLAADLATGIFTHYKREEDAAMEGGKLDEELRRMSEIADAIAPGGMLLCNESFASTNEREGSEIAGQIVRAMVERGVKVLFVTHMFEFAHRLHERDDPALLFLRAERGPGGRRTFRIGEGAPLPTSHGEDSYRRIFRAQDA